MYQWHLAWCINNNIDLFIYHATVNTNFVEYSWFSAFIFCPSASPFISCFSVSRLPLLSYLVFVFHVCLSLQICKCFFFFFFFFCLLLFCFVLFCFVFCCYFLLLFFTSASPFISCFSSSLLSLLSYLVFLFHFCLSFHILFFFFTSVFHFCLSFHILLFFFLLLFSLLPLLSYLVFLFHFCLSFHILFIFFTSASPFIFCSSFSLLTYLSYFIFLFLKSATNPCYGSQVWRQRVPLDCRPDGHTLPPPQGILQTCPILKSSLFFIE